MSYADKIGVPFIVLLGEDEIASGKLSVKNMKTGEQQLLETADACAYIFNAMKHYASVAPIRG